MRARDRDFQPLMRQATRELSDRGSGSGRPAIANPAATVGLLVAAGSGGRARTDGSVG